MSKNQTISKPPNGTPEVQPPSPNGSNGHRAANGQFAKGNLGGPGNPYGKQIAHIRSLILECVSEEDLRAIIATMIKKAKEGDLAVTRELLDRLAGKSIVPLDPERVELEKDRLYVEELKIPYK